MVRPNDLTGRNTATRGTVWTLVDGPKVWEQGLFDGIKFVRLPPPAPDEPLLLIAATREHADEAARSMTGDSITMPLALSGELFYGLLLGLTHTRVAKVVRFDPGHPDPAERIKVLGIAELFLLTFADIGGDPSGS